MNKALLILGDGEVIELTGRFVVITQCADDGPLSIVDSYCDGESEGPGVICDTVCDAADQFRELALRGYP